MELDSYSAGLNHVGRGLQMLGARPRLWGWVLAPALVALLILGAAGWWIYGAIDPAVASVASIFPDFIAGWISGFLRLLVIVVLAVGGYFLFFGIAALFAAPFNEMLSEAIELELSGEPAPSFSLSTFLRDLVVGIGHALIRVGIYVGCIVAIFVVGLLVPGPGTLVSTIAGALVTVRFAAFDAMDAVWARRGYSYSQKAAYLREHRHHCDGIGAGVALLMLIPGVNLVALSAGAVGATLFDHETAAASKSPRDPRQT